MTYADLPVRGTRLTEGFVRQGLRIELRGKGGRGRLGILTGVIDRTYPRPRVEVIPEGLCLGRLETWALVDAHLLPRKRQLVGLGGGFQPPKGYPLINGEPAPTLRN